MERLHIHHVTRYDYARPVQLNRHRLVLRPRAGHDLRVEQFELHIAPDHEVTWFRDVFGNSIAWVDFLQPARQLAITADSTVARRWPFPPGRLPEPHRVPYPVAYDTIELPIVTAYVRSSFPEDAAFVGDWTRSVLRIDAGDTEGSALALCQTIHQRIRYRRREERGVQTPTQTLTLGSGSCRDLATLFMEAARGLQLGARFASGYLHGSASLAGRASTHAWTEIYLPALGWRGFDATLGAATSLHHVVTGVSNHPRGVMPVSGTYVGDSRDFVAMDVHVSTEILA